ncbi:hypothetical protein [Catellatospora sichuanensis]|uniref:hypothetical protein n=1 Tax=Catellatospora sichuanensis TaxID=1969805 RepID=UPI00118208CF|nr:hypothetical protein [Catellatospora sichuanensis]
MLVILRRPAGPGNRVSAGSHGVQQGDVGRIRAVPGGPVGDPGGRRQLQSCPKVHVAMVDSGGSLAA